MQYNLELLFQGVVGASAGPFQHRSGMRRSIADPRLASSAAGTHETQDTPPSSQATIGSTVLSLRSSGNSDPGDLPQISSIIQATTCTEFDYF